MRSKTTRWQDISCPSAYAARLRCDRIDSTAPRRKDSKARIEFQFGGMHGMRAAEEDNIVLGSSVVVETVRTWRKHTKMSPLVAQLSYAQTPS